MTNVLYTAKGMLRVNKRVNTERRPNINGNVGKLWWTMNIWNNEQFKSKFRLTKNNFNIIPNRIES